MPSVVACQRTGVGRNIVPGNLRSGTRAATQKGRSHDTASALGVYEPQLPIRTMHCATAHHVPKAVVSHGYRRGVGRCQRGGRQRSSNRSLRPIRRAGRFVAAQVAVGCGSLRDAHRVLGEIEFHDQSAAPTVRRDRLAGGGAFGGRIAAVGPSADDERAAAADHTGARQLQPAVIAADAAADTGAGYHARSDADARRHADTPRHAGGASDSARDGDTDGPCHSDLGSDFDAACGSDGRAERDADGERDTIRCCCAYPCRADSDFDSDGADRGEACAVFVQRMGWMDSRVRGPCSADRGDRLVASPQGA